MISLVGGLTNVPRNCQDAVLLHYAMPSKKERILNDVEYRSRVIDILDQYRSGSICARARS
jgi:hypothetical protein